MASARIGAPLICAVVLVASGTLLPGCATEGSAGRGSPPPPDQNIEQLEREYLQRMSDCFTEAGFPSQPQSDGSLQIDDGPDDQQEAFRNAAEVCREQSGEPKLASLTQAQVGVLYDLQLEAGVCLRDAGFRTVEMPSRETWVSQYVAAQQSTSTSSFPVTPWDGLHLQDAEESCRQPGLQDVFARMGSGG